MTTTRRATSPATRRRDLDDLGPAKADARAELHRLQAEVVDDARRLVAADADHPWWEHVGLDPAAEAAVVLEALVAATRAALGSSASHVRTTPGELLSEYERLATVRVGDGNALLALVSDTAHASGRLDQLLEL